VTGTTSFRRLPDVSSDSNERGDVAKKTVLVSDLSGKEISDTKDGAGVVITFNDARRGVVRLDVLATEVADLASKGRRRSGEDANRRNKIPARLG
jgi:hypothetical protein